MMSHLMLNLHEATYVGIYTMRTSAFDGGRFTEETDCIELDTIWSGALDQPSFASHNFRGNVGEEHSANVRPAS
jgi:hypothetical protein